MFLELEYKFKDKDSVSFTTLFTQQLAQCLVLGGHSIFFKEMNKGIYEVKKKEGSRLTPGSLADMTGASGGTQREGQF